LKVWLNAITSIVIGPGLGRDKETTQPVHTVLNTVIDNKQLSLVGDADFLWFLSVSEMRQEFTEQIKKLGNRAILTPNVIEFDRLSKHIYGEESTFLGKKQS
jgi:NAD(P)H-hydrate repair Nnr-like enzyme with NAD(P)H-hydrate dehydratase domain